MTETTTGITTGITTRRPWVRRSASVAGAAGAALGVWALITQVGGTDLASNAGGSVRHIGPAEVLVSSLLAGLIGWAWLAWLERRAARPYRIWNSTATAAFAASLTGPLGAVSVQAGLGLAALHATVYAILIFGLPRT